MHVTPEEAIKLILAGNVVAIPTETVYGLAAALNFPHAITEIFSLKGRPADNPLIIHLSHANQIENYANSLPESYHTLAKAFWPGPMTLVLPIKTEKIPEMVRAGLPTAAFRVPQHTLTQAIIAKTGPLVMPSANLSGKPSATCAEHVETDFGNHFPVVNGNSCKRGVESTILIYQQEEWCIIRLGALAPDAFETVLAYRPKVVKMDKKNENKPLCPGQLYRHYAPQAHLTLTKKFSKIDHKTVIGFEDHNYPEGCQLISLGTTTDSKLPMQRLYAILRRLDQEGIKEALVDMNFPSEGLWLTLKERLEKAAQTVN